LCVLVNRCDDLDPGLYGDAERTVCARSQRPPYSGLLADAESRQRSPRDQVSRRIHRGTLPARAGYASIAYSLSSETSACSTRRCIW
jgi:hypothetical protein